MTKLADIPIKQIQPGLDAIEDCMPPLPTLIDWAYIPMLYGTNWGNRIEALEVRDHPVKGSFRCRPGETIITSEVVWLNREVGMVQTKNTLYRLERERKAK